MAEMNTGKVEMVKDHIGEKLDELADLAEYWKKRRSEGIAPKGVRSAMLSVIDEIQLHRLQEEQSIIERMTEDQKNRMYSNLLDNVKASSSN